MVPVITDKIIIIMKQLKTVKVLTLISYLSIMLIGEKIGGPIVLFIILDIFDFQAIDDLVISCLLLFAVIVWVVFIIKYNPKFERLFYPFTFIILSTPLVKHTSYLIANFKWISQSGLVLFLSTLIIFLYLYSLLIFKTFKNRGKEEYKP